jgi:hypothetical protein
MKTVILNYFKTAVIVAIEFLLAWVFAKWVICRYYPRFASKMTKLVLSLTGTGVLLVAGIGRLGWQIQTFAGTTPPECLDQAIFLVLSLCGTFLIVLGYFVDTNSN